jgi:hypothetical protein
MLDCRQASKTKDSRITAHGLAELAQARAKHVMATWEMAEKTQRSQNASFDTSHIKHSTMSAAIVLQM